MPSVRKSINVPKKNGNIAEVSVADYMSKIELRGLFDAIISENVLEGFLAEDDDYMTLMPQSELFVSI
jgi:hypothetical protein